MLKLARFAALALAAAAVSAPAFSADQVAATVNGVAIPQARVDAAAKEAASQGQADSPQLRKSVLDRLINIEILSQEATKKGLDKDPDTMQQLELARQMALASAFVQDYTKNHPASDDALKAEYDRVKNDPNNTQYKVAHILVESEADAKAVAAQLKKKGSKFEAVAKEKSKDPGSKESGGEMGWHSPADFVPPFAQAMAQLKKGEVSAPVQTQYGWHIIKVEDIRTPPVPPFEQAKPFLIQRLQGQAVQKLVSDLRKNAKVEGLKAE